jgi:phosphatidate cytidylyltransferase
VINIRLRIITSSIAVPIVAACIYFGGIPFLLLILTLAFISINEFYNMMRVRDYLPAYYVGNFFTGFFIIFAYYALKKSWEPAHSAIFTGAALVTMISTLFLKRPKEAIIDIAVTLLGMIYVGWFFSYFLFIRALTERGEYIFLLLVTILTLDTSAYFAGKMFGKNKLFPSISPKKTIEGAAVGFVACLVVAGLMGYFFGLSLFHALTLGLLIGISAQFGDLFESLIKRDAGVKDSSNLFPGHGGFLDRMDSYVLTLPVVYYYLVWVVLK